MNNEIWARYNIIGDAFMSVEPVKLSKKNFFFSIFEIDFSIF